MIYLDRKGNRIIKNDSQDRLLKKMYGSVLGRACVKCLIRPSISRRVGKVLDSHFSRNLIQPFVNTNDIDMSLYVKESFSSYNDFFMREIKSEYRPIEENPDTFISPCDAKLSIYDIRNTAIFDIKHTPYTVGTLTKSKAIEEKYRDGFALVFRLTVDDYHRFCYVDNGIKSNNRRIEGVLHTVNPIANDYYPIYKENTREYSLLKSENFGTILMMEVGALLVGKIVNEHENAAVHKGQEKGHFEFGGSTVILLVQKNQVTFDADILRNTQQGIETIVKMGERIGVHI